MTQENPILESMLAEAMGSPATQEARQPDAAPRQEKQEKESARPYDFRNPTLLSPAELRKLRLDQEDFIQGMATRLSGHLRLEFSLKLLGLETITFQKLAQSWAKPAHLSLFKIEPLRGVSVLEISTQLGYSMVDRLMGGPGHGTSTDQEISEIEKVLLEQTVKIILDEWCGHWAEVRDLKPSILGYESNGSFIQTTAPGAVMLVVAMEASFGDCSGRIQLGVPYAALDSLIRQICRGAEGAAPSATPPAPKAAANWKWNAAFDDVRVPVTAEWEGLELTARQILALKVGDVLPLDAKQAQKVNVRVADIFKFQGRPGTLDGHWAVELTKVITR